MVAKIEKYVLPRSSKQAAKKDSLTILLPVFFCLFTCICTWQRRLMGCALVSLSLCLSVLGRPVCTSPHPKKIYRLKEEKTKLFRFRWNWVWREKVARQPSADFLLHSVGESWRGWWFGRYCYCGENALERMRDNWFCGSFGTVPLNFLLLVQNCTSENCRFTLSFLANWNLYPMTESTERSPTHKWRKYILRVEGGFYVQYRGNVHLWPKSDESKKSLVLFYLFTLCPHLFTVLCPAARFLSLSICLSVCLNWMCHCVSFCLFNCQKDCISKWIVVCLNDSLTVNISASLPVLFLSNCQNASLSVRIFLCLSFYLSICQ